MSFVADICRITLRAHVMRGSKYELLHLTTEGKIEGRRGIGRKQLSLLRNIMELD